MDEGNEMKDLHRYLEHLGLIVIGLAGLVVAFVTTDFGQNVAGLSIGAREVREVTLVGGERIRVACRGEMMELQRLDAKAVGLECQGPAPTRPVVTPPASTSIPTGLAPSPTSGVTPGVRPSATPIPPPAGAGVGMPFGPFHYPTTSYGSTSPVKYTSGFVNLEKMSLADATAALEAAKAAGMRIMVSVPGAGARYKDANGKYVFDDPASALDFKGQIDRLKALDLEKYYREGVLLGDLIIDEPQDVGNWGVQVTYDQIKQAAAYMKTIWPSVPVGLYGSPDYMTGTTWGKADLDFLAFNFAEWKLQGQTKEAWLADFLADAKSAHLGAWLSINVLYGAPDHTAMTPARLKEYGEYWVKNDGGYACGLTLWSWESQDRNADGKLYFTEAQNPGVDAAAAAVLIAAKSHVSDVSCIYH